MGTLPMWAVYDHPTDYPDYYVARKWLCGNGNAEPQGTDEVLMDKDLDRLRAKLPPGMYCLPRDAKDDPVIVETWV